MLMYLQGPNNTLLELADRITHSDYPPVANLYSEQVRACYEGTMCLRVFDPLIRVAYEYLCSLPCLCM